ncbi:MAG: acyl-CoA dehydratase activase [Deltaproteobacteria bacterium]|jgi:predicted CoA-substrate-specific enzyme activase|nr:acyl-CoA dehydratase activase [Deltaproteobacteria bacterium]
MVSRLEDETVAGIDIGSRSIELVLLNAGGVLRQVKAPTTFDPIGQCRKLMDGINGSWITATGYGRKLFAESFSHLNVSTITEIQAYALGAQFLYPAAKTVLDIGGQDTKVISLSDTGKVLKFEMNDRCAAGTGKFLEFMAVALQVPLETFGEFALRCDRRIQISSMCTVFAESEATSLMARGERAENIAMGLHSAIVSRTIAMLRRVGISFPLVFAGGVARNPCTVKLLEEQLGQAVTVPENPDMVGAMGAALYGRNGVARI